MSNHPSNHITSVSIPRLLAENKRKKAQKTSIRNNQYTLVGVFSELAHRELLAGKIDPWSDSGAVTSTTGAPTCGTTSSTLLLVPLCRGGKGRW